MSETGGQVRGRSPFGRGAILGVVIVGFAAFLAMLYFLSVGDTGRQNNDGQAHAAANGLNGYSGLVRLLELEGYEVSRSRLQSGMDTNNLLVLTPPPYLDAEELSEILRKRAYVGPTLVIVPKWFVYRLPDPLPDTLPDEVADKIQDGWVEIGGAWSPEWLDDLEEPYALSSEVFGNPATADAGAAAIALQPNGFDDEADERRRITEAELARRDTSWEGMLLSGNLPEPRNAGIDFVGEDKTVLVSDSDGRAMAVSYWNVDEYGDNSDTEQVTFVVEPDLMNNLGMADEDRAALAIALIEHAGYGSDYPVTFDLTLNGFGGSVNLLTLAFRPPFLAATLCLLVAMLMVGWRAFKRFGPPAASGPAIAFGKSRLVVNGAGLIMRAKRLRLLADPYATLSARRLSHTLGLAKPDPEAIDNALATRLPEEMPFTHRAANLRAAKSSTEILRAARALKELEGKLGK